MQRLPPWIRVRFKTGGKYGLVQSLLDEQNLHTVCDSAHCPNRQECFNRGTATVMILGNVCTRNCRFCAVASPDGHAGTPAPLDPQEPERAAQLIKKLNLQHAVITSVTRDDLPDGGASAFAETISAIRKLTAGQTTIEVLTPDFNGSESALDTVLSARPDVFNHNLETVKRLQALVRPQADYRRSLAVLKYAAASKNARIVKSGLMAGMGENDEEIYEALRDLLDAGCRYLTIGQYLAPSKKHWPADRFVTPELFAEYEKRALAMGFKWVASGPLVRSSYLAENFFRNARTR